MKTEYYVEVTDKRVDLDPPYVWQSEPFGSHLDAEALALKLKKEFLEGKVNTIIKNRNNDYLNYQWLDFYDDLPEKRKGIKTNLHIYIMVMDWYNDDEYDIGLLKKIK